MPHVNPPVKAPAVRQRYRPSPLMIRVAIGACFGAMAISNIGTFLVRSLTDAGFGRAAAGSVQVVGSVTLIGLRVGWGGLMDERPALDRFAFSAGLLTIGTVAFPMIATGHVVVATIGALLAYSFGWSWPGVVHLATVEHNPDATGAASGVLQAAIFVGAMTGPALFGVVADIHGFAWAWMMVCAFGATAATLMTTAAAAR